MSKSKFTITDIQNFAREKNSQFLSDNYINGTTKYQWQCPVGHLFSRSWAEARKCPDIRWCQECKKSGKIEFLRAYAQERNGKCLSQKYVNDKTRYEWECKNGHCWSTNWNAMFHKKSWCGECRKYTLQDLNRKAEENGRKCLSQEHINDQTYHDWECKRGHQFSTVWSTIDIMKEYAQKKGGDCLSEKYTSSRDKYIFICSNKHVWEARWGSMKHNNSWCKECQKYTIQELQQHAKKKAGRLLSTEYINKHTRYEWECKEEHRWITSWDNVLNGGTWCRECSYASRTCKPSKKYTISDLQIIASEKGGLCLSDEYITADTRYIWKCKRDHTWKTKFGNVFYNGTWCPQCQKLSLKEAQEIARERGGRCLSENYINKRENMEWECGKGHRWFSTLGSVKYQGAWCIICWHSNRRYPIEKLREIAWKNEGKLISKRYDSCSMDLMKS